MREWSLASQLVRRHNTPTGSRLQRQDQDTDLAQLGITGQGNAKFVGQHHRIRFINRAVGLDSPESGSMRRMTYFRLDASTTQHPESRRQQCCSAVTARRPGLCLAGLRLVS